MLACHRFSLPCMASAAMSCQTAVATNAVAIDVVIPAQGAIAEAFGLAAGEGGQWAVLAIFVGAAISQIILGPAADAWGPTPGQSTSQPTCRRSGNGPRL